MKYFCIKLFLGEIYQFLTYFELNNQLGFGWLFQDIFRKLNSPNKPLMVVTCVKDGKIKIEEISYENVLNGKSKKISCLE